MSLSSRNGAGPTATTAVTGEVMQSELNARAEDLPSLLMRARGECPQHVWTQPAVPATVEAP